jgi:hypothetical protein
MFPSRHLNCAEIYVFWLENNISARAFLQQDRYGSL